MALHNEYKDAANYFFQVVPKALEDVEAIPLVVIGLGVGEGHHAKGAFVLLNSQNKSEVEMLGLLKYVVEKLEKNLQ